jgi:hypothetical protein
VTNWLWRGASGTLEPNRAERGRILDEFTQLTGFHRKHAARVLRDGVLVPNALKVTVRNLSVFNVLSEPTHGRRPVSAWGASLRYGCGVLAGIGEVRVFCRRYFPHS